jgi:hypothetical protein
MSKLNEENIVEEVCEDCDNGTEWPCDYCLEEDRRKGLGLDKEEESK